MASKLFRRFRMLQRARRMPWFTWRLAIPFCFPSWLLRATSERLLPVARDGNVAVVTFGNGERVATPPGCPKPIAAAISQYQFARYLDLFEARLVLSQGHVVVDGGAGFGTFALLASRLVGPQGRVVAIEPVPDSLAALRATVKANELNNVIVVDRAIGSEPGATQIHLPEGGWSGATGIAEMLPEGRRIRTYTVPVTTIDALVEELGLECVDFIKLNIEGMEKDALMGASETIRKYKPCISMSAAHLPDDSATLPQVIRDIDSSYVTALTTAASREHPALLAAPDGTWGSVPIEELVQSSVHPRRPPSNR